MVENQRLSFIKICIFNFEISTINVQSSLMQRKIMVTNLLEEYIGESYSLDAILSGIGTNDGQQKPNFITFCSA